MTTMRTARRLTGCLVLALTAVACSDGVTGPGGQAPAAPRALEARYYARAVYVSWELGPGWDDDSFRVYSRRTTDADYFLIAEVTSCAGGVCSYTDVNVRAGESYDYYVAAVDPTSGLETPSATAVQVLVPEPTPPPAPLGLRVVALDDANFLAWEAGARSADDFSHYRVYLRDGTDLFFLGETDSEGFLDLLAVNGSTATYVVSAVDDQGHESAVGPAASGTPRPDFHGEWLYDFFDVPASSGFRFRASEADDPILGGNDASRHFRLETDADGWWLVPGPGTSIYPQGFVTTSIKCGVGADAGCSSLDEAPGSGYVQQDVGVDAQTTYAFRVRGDDGQNHYGAVRVTLLGFDQAGSAIMIFDWAYQLQPGNPALAPRPVPTR